MIAIQAWAARLPVMTELALITLAAWLAAGWLVPSASVVDEQSQPLVEQQLASLDMKLVLETALFGVAEKAAPAPAPAAKKVAPSRLKITVLGTVVSDERSAAVVVMQGSSEQKLFFVNDTMSPGVVLKEVEADSIVVDNQGELERIELQKEKGGVASSVTPIRQSNAAVPHTPVSRQFSRNMVDRQIKNFPQLLSQARVIPHFSQGKSDGFTISQIVPGSLYEKAGLQNGDIIRKVNGSEVRGPQQAMEMFQSLQTAASIDVEIMRAGNVQQLHYDIQ